jgi:hypothetical protein
MFERKDEPLAPPRVFALRLIACAGMALLVLLLALALGVAGYHWFGGLGLVDSVLNASMILTGMGPVNVLATTQGKLFASGYALLSGLVFVTTAGVVMSPAVHRLLHHFHLVDEEKGG